MEAKEKEIMVSVCIQTYQHGLFIKDCLEGILNQETDFPFEIIIGEDESNDGTREICLTYADKYPEQIRLFLRTRESVIYINGRPTGRFNFTENLRAAKGKYIAICEGDDVWTDPLKLKKQVDFLEKHSSYNVCYHNILTGSVITDASERYKKDFGTVTKHDAFKGAIMPTCSMLFRNYKEILDFPLLWKYGFADWTIQLFLLSKGSGYYINEVMAFYRVSASSVYSPLKYLEKLKIQISPYRDFRKYFAVTRDEKKSMDTIFDGFGWNYMMLALSSRSFKEIVSAYTFLVNIYPIRNTIKLFLHLTRVKKITL
ncbi:MAG: glycosyltransferase [Flavobacteriales bacterium]|nr:glycosyltransferase [Flavobacteriales bacterium]